MAATPEPSRDALDRTGGIRPLAVLERSSKWLVAAVVVAAACCVVPRLGAQSLWTDEAFTIVPAIEARGWGDLVARVRALDTHPPLAHAVLYLTRGLLPQSELGWRLPSFVFVELGLVLLCATVSRVWNRRVGLAALVFGQISPYLLFYSMEARGYALWFLALAAALYGQARWAESLRDRAPLGVVWAWALGWGVANAAGMWTHLFHAFAMSWQVLTSCALAVWHADSTQRKHGVPTALGAWLLPFLAIAPWLAAEFASGVPASGVGWTREPSLSSLLYYPFALLFGSSLGPNLRALHTDDLSEILGEHGIALAAAAAALAILAVVVAVHVRSRWADPSRRGCAVALVIAPILTLLGPLAYVLATHFPLTPRHLMFVWPAIPVLLALTAAEQGRLRPPLVGVAAVMMVSSANLLWNPEYAKDDERAAVHYAAERSRVPAYVFGDVAPLYARGSTTLIGRFRSEVDDVRLEPRPQEVWLIQTREWQGSTDREVLGRRLSSIGFHYDGIVARFRGVALHHWRAEESPAAVSQGGAPP
jgi:hypothetical protein